MAATAAEMDILGIIGSFAGLVDCNLSKQVRSYKGAKTPALQKACGNVA
ncbi:hypothetical protein HHL08_18690 [Sphingobium sp. AR-3-1]|uniref:Uncharacterized protein n=1 Tax=Sphingobium psychrophilum TaxID=2728834 RepID=A0A7X9WZ20_9SPHN|nr:hypothetical protein [Sphingobium psychrophilum]NML12148.1 hypothetical protein [Sphingobium psychrophilum]